MEMVTRNELRINKKTQTYSSILIEDDSRKILTLWWGPKYTRQTLCNVNNSFKSHLVLSMVKCSQLVTIAGCHTTGKMTLMPALIHLLSSSKFWALERYTFSFNIFH